MGEAISRKLLWRPRAADAAGSGDWLRGNISAELAGFDEHTVDRLLEGSRAHARRRAGEMAAAADQLRELGVPPRGAAAARDLLAELRAGEA
jgi:NAD(P)H-hydrate repair Nnr-like enzyme with NAD(P)H-hydrate dehydratase domain